MNTLWHRICTLHRRRGASGWHDFFLPELNRFFLLRLGILALLALLIFGFAARPCFIDGASMVPTYPERGFVLCDMLRFKFREPERGDIVLVKYTGKTYFLKRIVALPGETVEFRNGQLLVCGTPLPEPYVKSGCDWEMSPRQVEDNHYYVIGDNRGQPIRRHVFGQVRKERIAGTPLW